MEKTQATQAEVNAYLDMLRKSGVTNMFGARPYIVEAFDVTKSEASKFLSEWMRTFTERHPQS